METSMQRAVSRQLEVIGACDVLPQLGSTRMYCLHLPALNVSDTPSLIVVVDEATTQAAYLCA